MTELTARQALALWQQANLLDPTKADELAGFLNQQGSTQGGIGRLTKVFSTLGAVLVGLGLVLFVGSNWGALGPLARGMVLFASYGLLVGLAAFSSYRGYQTVAGALWFVVTLALGANIFLLGQFFNFSLTYWQGPFLWMIGALATAASFPTTRLLPGPLVSSLVPTLVRALAALEPALVFLSIRRIY